MPCQLHSRTDSSFGLLTAMRSSSGLNARPQTSTFSWISARLVPTEVVPPEHPLNHAAQEQTTTVTAAPTRRGTSARMNRIVTLNVVRCDERAGLCDRSRVNDCLNTAAPGFYVKLCCPKADGREGQLRVGTETGSTASVRFGQWV